MNPTLTLGSLPTFNDGTPDSNGVEWWVEELTGWDSPDLREDTSPRGFRHGLIRGTSYYGGRPLGLRGALVGTGDIADLRAAVAALAKATDLTSSDATLTVLESPSKQCAVRRSGRLAINWDSPSLARFDLALLAVDPRKYATSTTTVGVGNGSTVTGTVSGDFDTPTVITLTPAVLNMTLTETVSGQTLTVASNTAVVINAADDTVRVSGALAWNRLTAGDFITLRGGDSYSFTTSGGTASIVYRAAWI